MRAIIGPERRRQDDDDGRHHWQDPARHGIGPVQRAVDLTGRTRQTSPQLGIGRKFQKPTVFESHTVWDNLELALKRDARRSRRLSTSSRQREEARIDEPPRDSSASARSATELAADLSHGQKQWLEIGMLLAQDPKLLLVDEPAAGMTDAETSETAKLLRDIAGDHSVIVVEHDMCSCATST
jgi:urea transport system ATP-binding protein